MDGLTGFFAEEDLAATAAVAAPFLTLVDFDTTEAVSLGFPPMLWAEGVVGVNDSGLKTSGVFLFRHFRKTQWKQGSCEGCTVSQRVSQYLTNRLFFTFLDSSPKEKN